MNRDNTICYHVEIDPSKYRDGQTLGVIADSLTGPYGTVVNTVRRFNGKHDLALIEVVADEAGEFEDALEQDERVVSFR